MLETRSVSVEAGTPRRARTRYRRVKADPSRDTTASGGFPESLRLHSYMFCSKQTESTTVIVKSARGLSPQSGDPSFYQLFQVLRYDPRGYFLQVVP
jgi:hypothetical protein